MPRTKGFWEDRLKGASKLGSMAANERVDAMQPEVWYGDSGGASRFYPQFKDDTELVEWLRRLIRAS